MQKRAILQKRITTAVVNARKKASDPKFWFNSAIMMGAFAMIAMAALTAVNATATPAYALGISFNFEWDTIWDQVSNIVNGLFPVFSVPIGLALGMGILAYIVRSIKSAI